MALTDELTKLDELRQRGVLTDEEFARAKARLLNGAGSGAPPSVAAINNFKRSNADRWVGGVCGGIARATGVDAWVWRLLFVVFATFGGVGVVVYALLWLFVPNEQASMPQ